MAGREIELKEKTNSSEKALKGLLEEGEWYQCLGLPAKESIEGPDLSTQEGHAIFHINEEGKIDMISYATTRSLQKKEFAYPIISQIIPRVKKDIGNSKGYERCPACQFKLKKQEVNNQ